MRTCLYGTVSVNTFACVYVCVRVRGPIVPCHTKLMASCPPARILFSQELQYGNPFGPPPLPSHDEVDRAPRSPVDAAWHLLRLSFHPRAPVCPLPPQGYDHKGMPTATSGASPRDRRGTWVRLKDYSLPWHLRLVLGELLHLPPLTANEPLHRSFLEQLEIIGCWDALLLACV